jgi:hypothetical protein
MVMKMGLIMVIGAILKNSTVDNHSIDFSLEVGSILGQKMFLSHQERDRSTG